MKKKFIIIIGILAFLLVCQTCSKCSSNRSSEFKNNENQLVIDSLKSKIDSFNTILNNKKVEIEVLKADNFNLRQQVTILQEDKSQLKEDKKNLISDKKELNKLLNK